MYSYDTDTRTQEESKISKNCIDKKLKKTVQGSSGDKLINLISTSILVCKELHLCIYLSMAKINNNYI